MIRTLAHRLCLVMACILMLAACSEKMEGPNGDMHRHTYHIGETIKAFCYGQPEMDDRLLQLIADEVKRRGIEEKELSISYGWQGDDPKVVNVTVRKQFEEGGIAAFTVGLPVDKSPANLDIRKVAYTSFEYDADGAE